LSTTAPFENKSIQTDSLSLYDPLPTNKIEAMLRIHTSDCSDTAKVLLNAFTTVNKTDLESLWIVAIVPELYQKVPLQHKTICSLYIALLRELMFEHIQTPTQLYEWLIKFVENNALGAHLHLATEVFGMLERWVLEHGDQPLGVGLLEDVFGAFVWALQTFIVYDNCPHLAFDAVRNSTNPIYKTFLRSFIGASYGWPYASHGSN
jgi:hypothetical protein